ncbi:MAG: Bug family tripartite tricarboxylate transporter substrate binding protein [Beijerinckiaceae bacterium]
MTNLSRRSILAGAAAAGVIPSVAFAQAFPSKPINIVVPFAPGGSTDVVARILAAKMSETLGSQVIVENRAGAGGGVGAAAVAKAAPDGHTILMGTISTHTLNPIMAKTKLFDPVKDFAPISLLATIPSVILVHPSLGVNTVAELVALLKKEPGKHSYASSGNGTPNHVAGELFKRLTGTDMQHVPYRGGGPAMNDLLGGQIKIMMDNLPPAVPHIRAGTIKALAVTVKERVPGFENIPTAIESGLKDYDVYSWNGLFAPAGTPAAVIAKLNEEANKAIKDPAVKAKLTDISALTVGTTPQQLAEFVTKELGIWEPVIKGANIAID